MAELTGSHRSKTWRPTGWIVGAVVIMLVAAACSSSGSTAEDASTADEASTADAAQEAEPQDAAVPCDASFNPSGYYEDAELAGTLGDDHSGMDMDGDGEEAAEAPDGTTMGDMDDGDDEPMDMSGGMGELDAAAFIVQLSEFEDAEYQQWLESLDPERDVEAPDDTGQGGHLGPQTWSHITDEATCAQLESELDQARAVADQYAKASDATAAGYTLVAPYLPGIASHWMKFDLVDGEFDVTQPEMLLYDGNTEDANLVGLSYFISAPGDAEPTVGFTSDNDHYHRHEGLCIQGGVVVGDSTTTAEECAARGGRKSDGGAGWMSHAWIVPGCESPWGVFSAQNPVLDQSVGENSGAGAPCSASQAANRWDLSAASGESPDN